QRLGRNAADIEAGTAGRLAALGAGGLEAELGSADRGDIAPRAAADHQDVKIISVRSHSKTPFALSLSKGCSCFFAFSGRKDRASTSSARTEVGTVTSRSTTASDPRSLP